MNKKIIIKQMVELYSNQDKDSNGGVLYEKFGNYCCFDLRGNSISSFVSLSEELYQANKNIVLKISFDKFFEIIKELVAKNTFSEERLEKEIDKIENKRHLFITSLNGIEDEKLKFLKIEKAFFINGIYAKQFFKEYKYKYIRENEIDELKEEKLLLAYETTCYDEYYGYKEFINYVEKIIDVLYLVNCSISDYISFSYAKNPIKVARIYCAKENGFSKKIVKEKDTQSFNLNIEDCFENEPFGRKLFEIVSKDNLSEIENRILRAIHLLRLSIDENDKGVSYVLISSAFEALLKQNLDVMLTGSIVFSISQNLAAILGRNYDECKDIVSYFKELYSVRSSVAHKGDTKSKKNKEVDIKKANEYLCDTIKKLCLYEPYRKYDSLDKIHSEIVEKKLYTFNIEGF